MNRGTGSIRTNSWRSCHVHFPANKKSTPCSAHPQPRFTFAPTASYTEKVEISVKYIKLQRYVKRNPQKSLIFFRAHFGSRKPCLTTCRPAPHASLLNRDRNAFNPDMETFILRLLCVRCGIPPGDAPPEAPKTPHELIHFRNRARAGRFQTMTKGDSQHDRPSFVAAEEP